MVRKSEKCRLNKIEKPFYISITSSNLTSTITSRSFANLFSFPPKPSASTILPDKVE